MLGPQDFRDVLIISREGSLKAAAIVLEIDASTMGRRLESIEARFGARLFMRTGRRLEPTPDAASVVAAAGKIEAVELAFQREMLAREPASVNRLTITCAEWGVPLLTPILVEVAARHSELRLHLRIENRALDLVRREADLALRIGRPVEKALVGRRIGVVRYGLYAAASYLEAHPPPRTVDDLEGHVFCALDHSVSRAPNVRWQAKLARDARLILQTNSMLSLVESVRAGGGLAVLPRVLGDVQPELVRVLPVVASVERDLWLVLHRDLRRSRAIRTVVDELVSGIRPLFA